MIIKALKWLRQHYFLIVNSIAFYPVIIAICFLLLAVGLLEFDFSDYGKELKSGAKWLSLKDSSTARTIIATVAAGIISLAVFSFSMVMILLNQAAVNMTNRILDSMIGNRFHQFILGFYIGTIVFAFFLLSTIRDIDSGLHIPSISIYSLIIFTIFDIFLFIYFLHYITQSVKYETIINRIHQDTFSSLLEYCTEKEDISDFDELQESYPLQANEPGYLHGFATKSLVKYCCEHDIKIRFLIPQSTYMLKGTVFAQISTKEKEHHEQVLKWIDIFNKQNTISQNPYLGFTQLAEVGIKALSPGINDPGTAILSLNRIADLLQYRLSHHPKTIYKDENDNPRILYVVHRFDDYVSNSLYPIWDYGKEDRMMINAYKSLLEQIMALNDNGQVKMINDLLSSVEKQHEKITQSS